MMHRFASAVLTISGAASLLLAACGQAATPSSQQASAAAGGSAQPQDWSQIEAAANKEGTLTVYALNTIPSDAMGRFQDAWNKSYPKIKVEMISGLNPPDVVAKVTAEQDAKAYTADVAQLGGTTGRQLDRLGAVAPFSPPAVQDKSVKWRVDPIQDEGHKGTLMAGTLSYV